MSNNRNQKYGTLTWYSNYSTNQFDLDNYCYRLFIVILVGEM